MEITCEGEELSELVQSLFEPITDKIQSESYEDVDFAIRVVHEALLLIEDARNKPIQPALIAILMPALFETFTNEVIGARGRAQILHLFYTMVRMVAWADGIDDDLVKSCLDESFNSWMALLLQIIQSNANKNA